MEKTKTLTLPRSIILENKFAVFFFTSIFSLSFFVPFLLGHSQLLVGTIVNACLFISAVSMPKKFLIPLIVFPSLGVLARGVVFGPFTPFLIYFLPFIWLSNLVLISVFKKLYSFNYPVSVFVSAVAKYLFLLIAANIYFRFKFVPAIFLQTMGLNQLLTALIGGIIFLIILFFYGRYIAGSQRTS
jgi:hypothetical protein